MPDKLKVTNSQTLELGTWFLPLVKRCNHGGRHVYGRYQAIVEKIEPLLEKQVSDLDDPDDEDAHEIYYVYKFNGVSYGICSTPESAFDAALEFLQMEHTQNPSTAIMLAQITAMKREVKRLEGNTSRRLAKELGGGK